MRFITTYFNTKIGALGKLLEVTKLAWDEQIWAAFILMILWTLFCTIGGVLLLPIDFIYCAIMWHCDPWFREAVEELEESFTLVEE